MSLKRHSFRRSDSFLVWILETSCENQELKATVTLPMFSFTDTKWASTANVAVTLFLLINNYNYKVQL